MEPNKIIPTMPVNTNTAVDTGKSAIDSFRDEGIDIVQGSGASEENEFSSGEATGSVEMPTLETTVPEKSVESTVSRPADMKSSLTRESATLIASLQEMPKSFIPTPKVNLVNELPKVAPIARQAPQAMVMPTGAPTQTPASTPSPVPPVKPVTPEAHPFNDPSIKQIRTFKSDAEEAVKYQNVSTMDIALAEQKKREKSTPIEYSTPKKSHAGIFIMIVIILILMLGGGWYYWFTTSQKVDVVQQMSVTVPAYIPYTKATTVTLDIDSDPLVLIGSKLAQLNAGLNTVYALVPIDGVGASTQTQLPAILKNTDGPDRLLRSLNPTYMLGVYSYDTQSPFMILKNTFFQNAFSGMLEWEKTMRDDLVSLVQVSHPAEVSGNVVSGSFEDALISNIDVRLLKNETGEVILAYAFANKDTIVITTDTRALKFILEKILAVRTIQ